MCVWSKDVQFFSIFGSCLWICNWSISGFVCIPKSGQKSLRFLHLSLLFFPVLFDGITLCFCFDLSFSFFVVFFGLFLSFSSFLTLSPFLSTPPSPSLSLTLTLSLYFALFSLSCIHCAHLSPVAPTSTEICIYTPHIVCLFVAAKHLTPKPPIWSIDCIIIHLVSINKSDPTAMTIKIQIHNNICEIVHTFAHI